MSSCSLNAQRRRRWVVVKRKVLLSISQLFVQIKLIYMRIRRKSKIRSKKSCQQAEKKVASSWDIAQTESLFLQHIKFRYFTEMIYEEGLIYIFVIHSDLPMEYKL